MSAEFVEVDKNLIVPSTIRNCDINLKKYGFDDCVVDCIHPNDIGYSLMADSIEEYLKEIIANSSDFKK